MLETKDEYDLTHLYHNIESHGGQWLPTLVPGRELFLSADDMPMVPNLIQQLDMPPWTGMEPDELIGEESTLYALHE